MDTAMDAATMASDMRVVLGQLIRRLRAEHRFPLSQGAVLGRLDREGIASIGDLAVAERVRPQSMTQIVADLEAEGLIARSADPADGRRTLIELTARGLDVLQADRRKRDGWLADAIEAELSASEQKLLARALELLRRLAESEPTEATPR